MIRAKHRGVLQQLARTRIMGGVLGKKGDGLQGFLKLGTRDTLEDGPYGRAPGKSVVKTAGTAG
jgi:hypothetical protein